MIGSSWLIKSSSFIISLEKSQQEAELQFIMQRDIEKEKLTNYEMLIILTISHQEAGSLWTSQMMNNIKNKKRHANIHLCCS